MLPKDIQILNFIQNHSSKQLNQNIRHYQFLRKQRVQKKQQQNIFSNNLLRKTVSSLNNCQQILQRKLLSSYSSRKNNKIQAKSKVLNQKINPYKQAIQENKNIEDCILKSLQKSLQIKRQSLSNQKREIKTRQQRVIKEQKQFADLKMCSKQFDEKSKYYQKLILMNPEQKRIQRIVKSASFNRIRKPQIRNFSELSDYLKGKSLSQSKLKF